MKQHAMFMEVADREAAVIFGGAPGPGSSLGQILRFLFTTRPNGTIGSAQTTSDRLSFTLDDYPTTQPTTQPAN